MDTLFQKLGLNEKQGKIYLAILELGGCSMTEVARKAKLKRPTCYLLVDELIILGLLTQTSKGKRKYYSAVHPRRLMEIAKNREREIEQIFPQLLALHNTPKDNQKVHVWEYNFAAGVDQLYEDIYKALKNGEEVLFFTNIDALRVFPSSVRLYKKMLKQLKDPRIRELNFGNEAGIAWAKEIKPYQGKNHFVRNLPTNYPYEGTDNMIFGNKVVICSLKKDIFLVVIENKNIADTYRAMFEWAWKAGK